MSESLSLLSEVGGVRGVGGGESGGVVDVVTPAEFWSTELVPPSVVDSSSMYSGLLWISTVDGPLQLCVHRSVCSISSKAILGGGGVLLHVSVRVSGYFRGKVPLESSPSSLRMVNV